MQLRDFMNRNPREGSRAARRNRARLDYRLCNGAAADQNRAATAANVQRIVRPAKVITVLAPKLVAVENTPAPVDAAQAAKDRKNAAARKRRADAKLAGNKLAEAA